MDHFIALNVVRIEREGDNLRGNSSVGLDPVQVRSDPGEGVGVSSLTTSGGTEGGDAKGDTIVVQGATRVTLN